MRPVLFIALVGLGACAGTDPIAQCDASIQQAITLHVSDARTAKAIAMGSTVNVSLNSTSTGFVVSSITSDTAAVIISGPAGAYSLNISRAGYSPFTTTVTVTPSDECGHPNRVNVSRQRVGDVDSVAVAKKSSYILVVLRTTRGGCMMRVYRNQGIRANKRSGSLRSVVVYGNSMPRDSANGSAGSSGDISIERDSAGILQAPVGRGTVRDAGRRGAVIRGILH
jgi:hypothetical protein